MNWGNLDGTLLVDNEKKCVFFLEMKSSYNMYSNYRNKLFKIKEYVFKH